MTNISRARAVIEQVCADGVREFCVCSGSRNAPLLTVLSKSNVKTWTFVDERSAAFFALGRIKQLRAPLAVVTTSGTAAAELLPALIEAHYSGLPLFVITADRPARFRGTGAPQAIDQVNLFGIYGTRHINVEFDEPLIDDEVADLEISGGAVAVSPHSTTGEAPVAPRGERPLVIIGGLEMADRSRVRDFVLRSNATVYAEPLSGLREELAEVAIHNERSLHRGDFDQVIRIGNVPTLRYWRDLETKAAEVLHFTRLPFTGLTRGCTCSLDALPEMAGGRDEALYAFDREQSKRIASILDEEPRSELAMIRDFSLTLPAQTRIYLGNSLPIREWDLAAARENRGFEYEANRGANGIDGQLSTFFGWCAPGANNVAVVGDLTALYDLNAPWIVPQLDSLCRVVIINNRGGRIFERVAAADRRLVINEHDLRFDRWSEMFGIEVTELQPDGEASARVWARYDQLWA